MSNLKLSDEQSKIISTAWKYNSIINSAAGSGKTSTLIATVREIVKNQPNAKILVVVFNTAIAEEINKKLSCKNVFIYTLHTMGNALLNSFPGKYKYNAYLMENRDKKYWTILNKMISGTGTTAIKNAAMQLVNIGRMVDVDFQNANDLYELAKSYEIPISGPEIGMASEAITKGIRQFTENKWSDFGDMIYLPYKLGIKLSKNNPIKIGGKAGIEVSQPFDYIACDEAQDFGKVMQEVIRNFADDNTKFLFFGDRLQAINGYCGADPHSFDNITENFDCDLFTLSTIYRCPPNHVENVNKIFNTNFRAFKETAGILEKISNIDYESLDSSYTILGRFRNGKEAKLWDIFFNILSYGKDATIFGMNPFELVNKIVPEELYADFQNLHKNLLQEIAVTQNNYKEKGWHNVSEDYEADSKIVLKLIEYSSATSWESFLKWLKKISYDRANCIQVSTVHTFKGRENENVILIDSDKFPYVKKNTGYLQRMQEECTHYVALTRSLNNLYLF